MQIDKEVLSEKNYTGTRLIEINDETVLKFQEQLDELQKKINPVLDKLQENYFSKVDEVYAKLTPLNEQISPLKDELKRLMDVNKSDTEFIDSVEQEAQLIKNKVQPIINDLVKGQLGEFETAKHTVVKDGKIYVEVFDEIEEKVKAIREKNASSK